MAWDKLTGEALGRGAAFLRRLSRLKLGEHIRLPMREFQDMLLPIPPDQRWTWAEKAEWFRSRAPFYCTVREDMMTGDWVVERLMVDRTTPERRPLGYLDVETAVLPVLERLHLPSEIEMTLDSLLGTGTFREGSMETELSKKMRALAGKGHGRAGELARPPFRQAHS